MAMGIPDEYSRCPNDGKPLSQLRGGDSVLICREGCKKMWMPPMFTTPALNQQYGGNSDGLTEVTTGSTGLYGENLE